MSQTFRVQLTADTGGRGRSPYPYWVTDDGSVGRQDVWKGNPQRVLGFQRDLSVNQVDLLWKDAIADPRRAAGMYLVTASKDGDFHTHPATVESLEPQRTG